MNNEELVTHCSLRYQEKKNARTEKAYEIDHADVCFWMS